MAKYLLAATIIGGSILGATGLWIYFSPYQSCVRAGLKDDSLVEAWGAEQLRVACATRR